MTSPDQTQPKPKKPIYKRVWFWLVIVFIVFPIFAITATSLTMSDEDRERYATQREEREAQKAIEDEDRSREREAEEEQARLDQEQEEANRAAEEEAAEAERIAAEAPQDYDGPYMIPLLIAVADGRDGVNIEATDIGQLIVDDVNAERGILDTANWNIVAQCSTWDGETLRVGVIKNDEFQAIAQAGLATGISENRYEFALDCP